MFHELSRRFPTSKKEIGLYTLIHALTPNRCFEVTSKIRGYWLSIFNFAKSLLNQTQFAKHGLKGNLYLNQRFPNYGLRPIGGLQKQFWWFVESYKNAHWL